MPKVFLWNKPQYIGGAATIALGLFILVESSNYPVGSLLRMGPGYFPTMLGVVLLLLGGLLFASGVGSTARIGAPEVRAPFFIGLGVASFALVLPTFGLAPAIVLLVVLSSFASASSRLKQTLIMAVVLIAFAWLVFVKRLSLPFALWIW